MKKVNFNLKPSFLGVFYFLICCIPLFLNALINPSGGNPPTILDSQQKTSCGCFWNNKFYQEGDQHCFRGTLYECSYDDCPTWFPASVAVGCD